MESKNIKKGDLVDIVWSGGNKGEYRIETDSYGRLYAVNSIYYNSDGSEKDSQSIEALRFYNPLENHIRSVIKKNHSNV